MQCSKESQVLDSCQDATLGCDPKHSESLYTDEQELSPAMKQATSAAVHWEGLDARGELQY